MKSIDCVLCDELGGELIFQNSHLRIIAPHEALYPGLIRVIWNSHAQEMTDLTFEHRSQMMKTVCLVEDMMREIMLPIKINLASLGNAVPHLHWHIIPRWVDDTHFPLPIWGETQRQVSQAWLHEKAELATRLVQAIKEYFMQHESNQ